MIHQKQQDDGKQSSEGCWGHFHLEKHTHTHTHSLYSFSTWNLQPCLYCPASLINFLCTVVSWAHFLGRFTHFDTWNSNQRFNEVKGCWHWLIIVLKVEEETERGKTSKLKSVQWFVIWTEVTVVWFCEIWTLKDTQHAEKAWKILAKPFSHLWRDSDECFQ